MSALMSTRRFCERVSFSSIILHIAIFTSLTLIPVSVHAQQDVISRVQELTDDNWKVLLDGEWFVKFYAPWCPACQSLEPLWHSLANSKDLQHIHVADIDVTSNAALSGKFFVTALPTIYHVKDGVFRLYRSSRSETELRRFIVDKKWQEVDPLPWYQHPDTYHMSALGLFFQVSISIRNLHSSITEDFGIPVWGSYLIIALATVVVGLAMGLLIVCLCDVLGRKDNIDSRHEHSPVRAPGDINDDESDVLDDREIPSKSVDTGAGTGGSETSSDTTRQRRPRQE